MKKFSKILVASMLLLAVVFSFASCAIVDTAKEKLSITLNLGTVKESFEEEDYLTEIITNEYYIKYELQNNLFPYVDLGQNMPIEILLANPSRLNDHSTFVALKFESSSISKEAYAILEPEIEYFVEEYNESLEKDDIEAEDFAWGRKEDVIYFGTVNAVKIAIGMPGSLFVFKK